MTYITTHYGRTIITDYWPQVQSLSHFHAMLDNPNNRIIEVV